jgi:hypothetical protein
MPRERRVGGSVGGVDGRKGGLVGGQGGGRWVESCPHSGCLLDASEVSSEADVHRVDGIRRHMNAG